MISSVKEIMTQDIKERGGDKEIWFLLYGESKFDFKGVSKRDETSL